MTPVALGGECVAPQSAERGSVQRRNRVRNTEVDGSPPSAAIGCGNCGHSYEEHGGDIDHGCTRCSCATYEEDPMDNGNLLEELAEANRALLRVKKQLVHQGHTVLAYELARAMDVVAAVGSEMQTETLSDPLLDNPIDEETT